MDPEIWRTIEHCAREWLILEIYYSKAKNGEKKRYELLPISRRGHLLYARDLGAERAFPKAFKIQNIVRAAVIETRKPPIEKSEIGALVEIGSDPKLLPGVLLIPRN